MIDITTTIKNQIQLVHLEETREEFRATVLFRRECINMYKGEQLEYIEHYCHFSDTKRQAQMQYSFSNITQKIINRVCLTYLNIPSRIVTSRQERYNEVTKGKRSVMIKLDRYSELLDRIGLKLEWNGKKQVIKYRPIIDNIYFEYDQYGDDVTAVYFPIFPCAKDKKDKHKVMYEYWDMEHRYILDYQGKASTHQEDYGFEDDINHYGILPVILIEKDGFFAKGLINSNKMINAGLTQLNELTKFKAFSVPYATGITSDDKIEYNVDTFLILDSGEKAGSIENKAEIVSVIEGIKFQIQLVAENYGVTFNWSLVGNVSGFSLMVQNVELYDQLKLDNEIKQNWEAEIFELENKIIEVDAKSDNYGKELEVNFVEYKVPINNTDADAHENHLLLTGQTNPIELMMDKDPDLSLEEATEKYNDNLAFAKKTTTANTATTTNSLFEKINSGKVNE